MNTAAISKEAIEAHISQDISACEALLDLLEQEQQALKERDADKLADVVERKAGPLTHLEESAKQRALWANETDISASSKKWRKLIEGMKAPKIQQDWATLKSLTLQCQQKNEVNGRVLARQQQVYSRLLGIMRGQTVTPNLYNAQGSATSSKYSIKVDEA